MTHKKTVSDIPNDIRDNVLSRVVIQLTTFRKALIELFRRHPIATSIAFIFLLVSCFSWIWSKYNDANDAYRHIISYQESKLLPGTNQWEEQSNEFLLQFLVVDASTNNSIANAQVSREDNVCITNQGGLTDFITSAYGNRFIIKKNGYQVKEVVICRDHLRTRCVKVELKKDNNI